MQCKAKVARLKVVKVTSWSLEVALCAIFAGVEQLYLETPSYILNPLEQHKP